MPEPRRVRVGVLGAGAWARVAHLPGFASDPRCELVAIADPEQGAGRGGRAGNSAFPTSTIRTRRSSPAPTSTWWTCARRAARTSSSSWAALEAGKHVLCEKPVAFDFRDTRRAAELARAKGLKTKLGFTFRYAPAMRYMPPADRRTASSARRSSSTATSRTRSGSTRRTRCARSIRTPTRSILHVSSLEGYGAPIIDIAHLMVGADLSQVVGTMRNFIPERMVRATGKMMRMNIDDGDIFIGEFANGALGSIQTSFVTVGNYPGIEARLYGSEGAIICRLVEEYGICERIKARPTTDHVEFTRARGAAAASIRRAAARGVVAVAVLRQPHQQLHRRDPGRRRRATRATSTTARGCRRRSTPSSSRSGNGAG